MHITPEIVHNFLKAVGVQDCSPLYEQRDPNLLFKKRRRPPKEFWLLLTKDCSILAHSNLLIC